MPPSLIPKHMDWYTEIPARTRHGADRFSLNMKHGEQS